MNTVARSYPLHEEARTRSARALFASLRSPVEVEAREAFIAGLPLVYWKGKPLRTLRCNGTTGRGPHDRQVPESLLWSLIDPRRYHCPYHPIDPREVTP